MGREGSKRSTLSQVVGAIAMMTMLAAGAPGNAGAPPSDQQIWKDAQVGARAYALLRDLTTQIGPRLTGSDKGRRAEDWALREFRAAGYPGARFAPFKTERWVRGPLSLTIDGQPIAAAAFGGNPARANIAADIVEMGDGIDATYAAAPDKVRGKIALIYYTVLPDSPDATPFLTRWAKIRLAIRYGAKGVVFINRGQGNALSTGQAWLDGPLPIPVVMIGHDEGLALRARLREKPLAARLDMTNQLGTVTARNIVASLPGTDPKAEHIVFGAHLDSWDLATGALDNGAGAVGVLELARVFKEHGYRPKRTIDFVLYMGEEQGDLGSTALLKSQIADGSANRIGYVINSDMSYDPRQLNTWGADTDPRFFPTLAADLKALHPDFSTELQNKPMPGGDPQAYSENGIPVLYIGGYQGPNFSRCQHAGCDRLDIIEPGPLGDLVSVSAVTVFRLANADRLPASRMRGKALDDYLVKNGLKDWSK